MQKQYIEITHRDIAKMLCSALPVQDEAFGEKVEEYLAVINAMPKEAKIALKVAYVFSRKVPREEREDLFQDLALAVFKAKTKDERLAYAIARCDWMDWWKKYKIRQHYSIDSVINDEEGNAVTLADMLVGEVEFERKVNGKLDAERLWTLIPDRIRPLINKRLIGKPLTNVERSAMSKYVKKDGYKLLLASSYS